MKISRPEDLGAIIRGYRKQHGLSQTALAKRIQTSQKWVSEVENGKPTAHIGLILKALNELGFSVTVGRPQPPKRLVESGKRRHRPFTIDEIVDG